MKKVSYEKYDEAFEKLQSSISDHRIQFFNMRSSGRNSIDMGVNWASVGTVSPDELHSSPPRLSQPLKPPKNLFITVIRLKGDRLSALFHPYLCGPCNGRHGDSHEKSNSLLHMLKTPCYNQFNNIVNILLTKLRKCYSS